MEARELRLGNLAYELEEEEKVVRTIYKVIKGDNTTYINDMRSEFYLPIPLTEEWLVKFGFESIGDFWEEIQANIYSEIRFDICDEEITQYVHQLQNLYFALAGKELELKNND